MELRGGICKYIFSIPQLVVFFIKPKTYQPPPSMMEHMWPRLINRAVTLILVPPTNIEDQREQTHFRSHRERKNEHAHITPRFEASEILPAA
jgi:hypothetical protein